MVITIPPWGELVARFGIDEDGDIGDEHKCYFYATNESKLSPDRTVYISDEMDSDGDYEIQNDSIDKGYFREEFVNFCLSFHTTINYGTSKLWGLPV